MSPEIAIVLFIVVLGISLLFGLVGRDLAKRKGNQLAGFFLGFFLWFPGLIIILLMPFDPNYKEPEPKKRRIADKEPEVLEEVEPEETVRVVCPSCNSRMKVAASNAGKKVICKCGEVVRVAKI